METPPETIMYDGAEIPVEKVGEVPINFEGRVGNDILWRSEAGDYYRQSERWNAGMVPAEQSNSDYFTEVVLLSPARLPGWLREYLPSLALDGADEATPPDPLTVTLSPEATAAVLAYRDETGRVPVDIASGILAAEITTALKNPTDGDDSTEITADQVREAACLRVAREEKAGVSSSPVHRVVLELTPGQHGALAFLAEHDGYASVQDCLLGYASGCLGSLGQAISKEKLTEFFGLQKGDGREEA